MIRTIIIDDEPLAIEALEIILQKKCKEDVQVIATSNSPQLGKELIEQQHPDLVILDVEMPGISGIDLVRSFSNPAFRVVFITAFDAYAVEAFRLSAVDYLLKPVEADDIVRLIEKIKNDLRKNENTINVQLQQLQQILLQSQSISESKIGIGMEDKIVFINIPEILYCEAQGAYTHVYLQDGKKLLHLNHWVILKCSLTGINFFVFIIPHSSI